jgi:hypothetical protein
MFNLFSLAKAISTKGVQLSSKVRWFWCIKTHPNTNHIAVTAQTLDINRLHTMFGQPNSQVLAATFSKYGFHTKNTLEHTCPNLPVLIEAKQFNLDKLNSNRTTDLGGRINIDILSVQNPSYGVANFWILIQDDITVYLRNYFVISKSELPESMFDWLNMVRKDMSLIVK